MLLGVVLAGVIAHWQLPIDPVHDLLTMMNVDRFWTRCILSNRQRHAPTHNAYDLVTVLREVYQQSDGVKEVIKNFIKVLRSPLPMIYFLCHPFVAAVVNIFLLGALPIGVVGFGGYFLGMSPPASLLFALVLSPLLLGVVCRPGEPNSSRGKQLDRARRVPFGVVRKPECQVRESFVPGGELSHCHQRSIFVPCCARETTQQLVWRHDFGTELLVDCC